MENKNVLMYLRVGNENQLLPHKGKKAALYCRVAHGDASDNLRQRKSLLEYAKNQGLLVTGFYEDVGSGLTIDRPGISRMLSDYKSGLFDVVLVQNRSRIARSLPLHAQLPFEVLSIT